MNIKASIHQFTGIVNNFLTEYRESAKLLRRRSVYLEGKKYKLYNWLIVFAAAVGGFLSGYEAGIINQVFSMPDFNVQFGICSNCNSTCNSTCYETNQAANIKGWITFTFVFGCAVGAVVVSYPADKIGRKLTIHLASCIFIVGCILQTAAVCITMLYVGRFLAGIGTGITSAVVPLYISEIAETSVRGKLISVYQFMITIGIFLASCVNSVILTYFCGEKQWRLAFGVQIVPALFLVIVVALLPFSPRWLIFKGSIATARDTLNKLRGVPEDDIEFITEFQEILTSIEEERATGNMTWKQLIFEHSILRRVFIGVTLQFFQQWTGINLVIYYGTSVFISMQFSLTQTSITFVLTYTAISMISTIPGMYLIDYVGRKKLLMWGGLLMGISHFMVTVFLAIANGDSYRDFKWAGVITIFIFVMVFASTWGLGAWVYQSEIFSLRSRAKGTSLCTFSNWFWNAIIAKISPIMIQSLDFYIYLIFGTCCFIMALFAHYVLPETNGKSLEEIDKSFERSGKDKKTNSTLN